MMTMHYEANDTIGYAECVRDSGPSQKRLDVPWPAIMTRRNVLWTGKQVVSMLVPKSVDITKTERATMDDYYGPTGLVVRHGELLAGRLNKSFLGAANTGIVHAIWRLYGPGGAHKFISDAQRLFVRHLQLDGPTQSIVDCMMDYSSSRTEANANGVQGILSKYLARSDAVLGLPMPPEIKEAKASSILQETLRSVGAHVLTQLRQTSALANCVNSGSKGNVMNIAQIGGCVGQQTVYGRRVPLRATRLGPRTLVYYAPGDLRAEARGFISNSYMSGLTPAEFFEHQMAGREGIVATAVNTSESGYNQRRMIKGQESQCVSYDGTVRVSSNIIIQPYYGGDDLDGSRLEKVKIHDLFDLEVPDGPWQHVVRTCQDFLKAHSVWRANLFRDLDTTFPCAVSLGPLFGPPEASVSRPDILIRLFDQLCAMHAHHHSSQKSLLNVSIAATVVQAVRYTQHVTDHFDRVMHLYIKALVNPGEGVGALGASSIGEPSMQMTLNVFHYSGIADKNVTITGLPRFKQLINSVDTCETANMTAAVKSYEDISSGLQISVVILAHVLERHETSVVTGPALFAWAYHTSAISFGGPISQKLGLSGKHAHQYVTNVKLSWRECSRRNIQIEHVASSIRETLSYDAIVIAKPHWSEPVIHIYWTPLFQKEHIHATMEGLLTQQQVRGLDYVKNVIAFQEKHWASSGQLVSRHVLETEGSNILDLAKCPSIVPETIRSTNVVEVCNVLGITAGLTTLQAELHKVLSFDSSYIDPRHTWLLTDTMGRIGTLAAMNRHNMESLGSSLLQRASFEQSLDVFEEGAAFGRHDPLAGATERIITGQPVGIGTGLMGIRSDVTLDTRISLVEPLHHESRESQDGRSTMVEPLYAFEGIRAMHGSNTWNPEVFMSKLTEMSKECGTVFETIATEFRSAAATRRQVPSLKLEMGISEEIYSLILQQCQETDLWTTKRVCPDTIEVFWTSETLQSNECPRRGATVTRNGVSVSSIHDLFVQGTTTYRSSVLGYTIYGHKELDKFDLPFGVEASLVCLRHESIFTKGAFQFTLAYECQGDTNTKAEESLMHKSGAHKAILELVEPDIILQNRCTDAQLGNALQARLTYK
jgi:DNA-directed RNA polymerase beta' subunit